MGLYTNARQSTVRRICLVGPRAQGLALARALYARCGPLGHKPAFIPAERLTKKLRRQLLDPVCPTGVLLFGAHAAEDYDSLLDLHPWIKVLHLVPPDAPEPKAFFSWHEQVFRFPQTGDEVRLLQVWLGLDGPAEWPPGRAFPGALAKEELRDSGPPPSPGGGPGGDMANLHFPKEVHP